MTCHEAEERKITENVIHYAINGTVIYCITSLKKDLRIHSPVCMKLDRDFTLIMWF